MDRAVKDGKVVPGQYLVLNFDFTRVNRSPPIEKARQSLAQEVDRALLDFKRTYADYLGDIFASKGFEFFDDDPITNLGTLIMAVRLTLQNIHNKGDKNHPLFGVKGVCLFQITAHNNAF